jgi:hypothetical protein
MEINSIAIFFIFQQFKTLQHDQFPVKIAFAVTVSQAEGQTLTCRNISSIRLPPPPPHGIFLSLFILQCHIKIVEP